MAKVLVTGCAGFIGSHLAEALLQKNHEVTGIDCFTPYYPRKIKEENLKTTRQNKNFKFIEADITKYDLKKLIRNKEIIFHEAAQPGVRYSWENFDSYLKNNILATQKLLSACTETKPKFIFASSSSVYGDSDELPIKESLLLKPISPYGITKVACENLCYAYHRNYGIPIIILRYFTVYGPRQRPDMLINKIVHNIFSGKEIEIYGDGTQSRDFTFISDIVEATISAASISECYSVFNIGGGSNITLLQLIQLIENFTGKKAKIKYMEEQKGDMKHTKADISRATETLKYTPRVKIEEGIKKYIESV